MDVSNESMINEAMNNNYGNNLDGKILLQKLLRIFVVSVDGTEQSGMDKGEKEDGV